MRTYILIGFVFFTLVRGNAQSDTLEEFTKKAEITDAHLNYSMIKLVKKNPDLYCSSDDMGSLLQSQSVLFIKTYGMGGISALSIRGGGANHTQVLWNNIAINSPTLGQTDLSLLPVEFSASATIYEGASSSSYENGGISGSLVLRQNSVFYDRQQVRFTKEMGSFGIDKTTASYEFGSKKWTSKTVLIRKQAENNFSYSDYSQAGHPMVERENAQTSQLGVQQSVGYSKNRITLALVSSYLDAKRHVPTAIGTSNISQIQLDQSFKNSLQIALDSNEKKKWKIDQKLIVGFVEDRLNYSIVSSGIDSYFRTQLISVQYHALSYFKKGFTIRTQVIDNLSKAHSTGFRTAEFQNKVSGFAELSKIANHTSLSGHVRQEYVDQFLAPLIYGIALKQSITPSFIVSLNAGQNYHYPTLNDRYWITGGNPELQPEIAKQGELGLSFNADKKNIDIRIQSSLFYGNVENWIQWIPDAIGNWSAQNVKQVEKKGVSSSVIITEKQNKNTYLSARINHQYLEVTTTRSAITNDESIGKYLIYTPKHTFGIVTQFGYKKMYLNYNQKVTGKVFVDANNSTYLPYSAPANVELGYSFQKNKESIKCSFNVFNVYNEPYQTVANQPLPGRYYSVKLTLTFDQ